MAVPRQLLLCQYNVSFQCAGAPSGTAVCRQCHGAQPRWFRRCAGYSVGCGGGGGLARANRPFRQIKVTCRPGGRSATGSPPAVSGRWKVAECTARRAERAMPTRLHVGQAQEMNCAYGSGVAGRGGGGGAEGNECSQVPEYRANAGPSFSRAGNRVE